METLANRLHVTFSKRNTNCVWRLDGVPDLDHNLYPYGNNYCRLVNY